MADVQQYERRIQRERTARKEAERLLEAKSIALYEKNLELFSLSESLEKLVAERTAQMQKARDDALNALQVKTNFIANMSHELRTPMNGVLGVIALLQNEPLNPSQRELLDVAESSGKHLLEVINDILDFSKMEANKISIELSNVFIRAYIKEIIAPFSLQAHKKDICVEYNISDDVEECLITDKLRLTQIITNLLSNAIKFTPQGKVSLSFSKQGPQLYRLKVSDTGIGISAENLKSVFAAFEQADTSITREFGGTGLGMNITKRLIDMLGGSIKIESTLGKGTCFYLDIPMNVASNEIPETVKAPDFNARSQALKLLLVEDHKVNQMIAQRLLQSFGFDVMLAQNGAQALDMVKDNYFNGILMDLQMPVMGGIQATKILRKENLIASSTPIIAMSAHNSPEHIKECFDAGMQDHVSKPVDKDHLLSVLEKHLASNINTIAPVYDAPNISIAHLAIDEGLRRVSGDWPLLHSLLKRFLEEFCDIRKMFSEAKSADSLSRTIAILHKIKGSGGNLGLTTLARKAGELEALMHKNEQWPNSQSIEQLATLLNETIIDFSAIEMPRSKTGLKAKIKADKELIIKQILNSQESLKQDVFAAEHTLNELFTFELDTKLEAVLVNAQIAMQAFDTAAVNDALTQARQMME